MSTNPTTHTTTYTCLTCADGKVMATTDEIKQHALDAHGVTLAGIKGMRKMLLCLDGSGFYSNDYEWDFGKVKFRQTSTGPKNRTGRIK